MNTAISIAALLIAAACLVLAFFVFLASIALADLAQEALNQARGLTHTERPRAAQPDPATQEPTP